MTQAILESGVAMAPLWRRSRCRFPVVADLEYRLFDRGKPAMVGHGQTVNLSSHGVLFEAEEALLPGKPVELWIAWPVKLDEKVRLRLWAFGRIVRIQASCVAVRISRYEFRTRRLETAGQHEPMVSRGY
ncbi:MAG: PilZ domain-containing protein [Acidobacteriia bacterium]|nr:PilZ domain-containing protein [Terriglobia bacterium]